MEGVNRTVPIGFLDLAGSGELSVGLSEVVDSGGGEGWVTDKSRLEEIGSYLILD